MFVIKRDGRAEVFFDSTSGLKVRRSPEGLPYDKSTTPELVDIKITDYCPYKCSFCYQASLPDGKHGSLGYIKSVLTALGMMKTFEVAYGGGEPAEHPDFAEIVEYTHQVGIVPNFTSFGVTWLKDEAKLNAVRMRVGGIGVSVHDAKSISKVERIKDAMKGYRPKVMVQHVFGTKTFEETMSIVDATEHMLFLGYKTVGFGNRFQPYKFTYEEVARLVRRTKKLSVDTAFVDAYSEVLSSVGVNPVLMASPEGKFSCYVDAVECKMAPSSYVEKDVMVSLPHDKIHSLLSKEYLKW